MALIVAPIVTTEYYARAEGTCNTTSCISLEINVNDTSSITGSIVSVSSTTVCESSATTLTVAGGNMEHWQTGIGIAVHAEVLLRVLVHPYLQVRQ